MQCWPQPGKVCWGNHSAPAPDGIAGSPRSCPRSAPGQGGQSPQPSRQACPRGVSGTHRACVGTAAQRSSACSESPGTLGPSQDGVQQPGSPSRSSCPPSHVPPKSSHPRALTSRLACLFPAGTQRRRGTPGASRTKGRKGGCWVVGSSCCLVSGLAGASPWGTGGGTAQEVQGGLTPARSVRPHPQLTHWVWLLCPVPEQRQTPLLPSWGFPSCEGDGLRLCNDRNYTIPSSA